MLKKILCLIIVFTFFNLYSQDNEIGVFVGGTNYIGDIGPTTYVNPFAYDGSRLKLLNTIGGETTFYALGVLYRKNFNNRIAARIHFNHANIGSKDKLPKSASYRKLRDFEFVNTIQELGIGIDFNFFEFDLKEKSFQITPYIRTGISYLRFNSLQYPVNSKVAVKYAKDSSFSIPITLGFKVKPIDRFVVGFEVTANHSFTDNLDGSDPKFKTPNPNSQGTFGTSLSKDWYVFSGFTLTYIFGAESCYCPK